MDKEVCPQNIGHNLAKLKEKIAYLEQKYGRKTDSVTLVAVSKKQALAKLQEAFQAGQRAFAENHAQEALVKIQECHALGLSPVNWHFIGPIQSNKTRIIAEHFSWAHCLESTKIAQRLNDQRPEHLPPLNVCIQVNISQESTKHGLTSEQEIVELAAYCQNLSHIRLRGLMGMTNPEEDSAQHQKNFHYLFELKEKLHSSGFILDTLSMGMSADLEAAIAEGSTLVRIGTSLFGPRQLM